MSMTKKDFIELADTMRPVLKMRDEDGGDGGGNEVRAQVIAALCTFCRSQNPRFMRDRWVDYLNGECGPYGGRLRKKEGRSCLNQQK